MQPVQGPVAELQVLHPESPAPMQSRVQEAPLSLVTNPVAH